MHDRTAAGARFDVERVGVVLSQALNAVLLLAVLPFLRALALDPEVMGEHRLGRTGRIGTAILLGMVAVSVIALGVLVVLP